jgi:hypothetical protein
VGRIDGIGLTGPGLSSKACRIFTTVAYGNTPALPRELNCPSIPSCCSSWLVLISPIPHYRGSLYGAANVLHQPPERSTCFRVTTGSFAKDPWFDDVQHLAQVPNLCTTTRSPACPDLQHKLRFSRLSAVQFFCFIVNLTFLWLAAIVTHLYSSVPIDRERDIGHVANMCRLHHVGC